MSGDDQSRDGSGNESGNGGGQESEEDGPSTAEKAVMAISVAFTVMLFAFVIWQALTAPTGVPPQATVDATQSMPDGTVRVAVRLTNPSEGGLQIVTVEVDCTDSPPEIQFEHIPAEDYQIGYATCPSGTSDPEVSVTWWIEA